MFLGFTTLTLLGGFSSDVEPLPWTEEMQTNLAAAAKVRPAPTEISGLHSPQWLIAAGFTQNMPSLAAREEARDAAWPLGRNDSRTPATAGRLQLLAVAESALSLSSSGWTAAVTNFGLAGILSAVTATAQESDDLLTTLAGWVSDSSPLTFDPASGVLVLRGDAGDNTVRQGVTAAGFVEVTLDGREHSSDPAAAAYHPALAGVGVATLKGVRFDGSGGSDKLTLNVPKLPHGFAVAARDAEVIAEDVIAAGSLRIDAARLKVLGALRGDTVALTAAGLVNIEKTAIVQAASGGRVEAAAEVLVNIGQLRADGPSGGSVLVQARNVLNAGLVTANGRTGSGGTVQVGFTGAYIETAAGQLSARGAAVGGHILVTGNATGRLYTSGTHVTTGAIGGAVDLFGREVLLVGGMVDASGVTAGGSVRIGGDFQGRNAAVVNAQAVTITSSAVVRADAQESGDGGRVIVWADGATAFAGSVYARGGASSGDGGFIEVSGKGDLEFSGNGHAGAPRGKAGRMLLDPKNIIISEAIVAPFPQYNFINPNPVVGGHFGDSVTSLQSGNVVVTDPNNNFGGSQAGAAYLFHGFTGHLISALVGSSTGDLVGRLSATPLTNGNYVLPNSRWDGMRGAVTWGSGTTGVSGFVSDANSLVGTNLRDAVSSFGIVVLNNGNYLVRSPHWNAQRGAVTWGDGATGITGEVSLANSLVGSDQDDRVGMNEVTILSNGNYIIATPDWNDRHGAVTWANAAMGVSGAISAANSLVGTATADTVGSGGITTLNNGNYVVASPDWDGRRGAATWGNGAVGINGTITAANSLVGQETDDRVSGFGVTSLSNGNYVVSSSAWSGFRGAVTWGNGATGVIGSVTPINSLVALEPFSSVGSGGIRAVGTGHFLVFSPNWNGRRGAVIRGSSTTGISGAISTANSLVGTDAEDRVGSSGVTILSNGNYLIHSPTWNGQRGALTWVDAAIGSTGPVSAANSLVGTARNEQVGNAIALANGNYVATTPYWNESRGAATWGSGATGVRGLISAANSLVGSNPGDDVSNVGVAALPSGNYVVLSRAWNAQRGAVTWGNGMAGITGTVTTENSLVGGNANDRVGESLVLLSNGNYVIRSVTWNGMRGAATWGSGMARITGTVSSGNSLIGSMPNDRVGTNVSALSNGNYVVMNPYWNSSRGAATWGSGLAGVRGSITIDNSLTGSTTNDHVGERIIPLPNGNYVVRSVSWNGTRGAVTWGRGSTGTMGVVSAGNSLVGDRPSDYVGYEEVVPQSNSDYLVVSRSWNSGRGAVTWVHGASGQTMDATGHITVQNSVIGQSPQGNSLRVQTSPIYPVFLASFDREGMGHVRAGVLDVSSRLFSFGMLSAQTLGIKPTLVTNLLNAGTAVTLQASNDITVNTPLLVAAGGRGGALTLQAGRSIVLNASILTDQGALTLIANETEDEGVVDSQRDPGQAVIAMASGTTLDTGSAPLTIELRNGTGLTNRDSGNITLRTVTAGAFAALNDGPRPGSDLIVGPILTAGPQSYTTTNGTTRVRGNLAALDNSITFASAVAVGVGVVIGAGSDAAVFTGESTQTLDVSPGAHFRNVVHSGKGTLRLLTPLTVTGTILQSAGTFDANDHEVTVNGQAAIEGGSYRAGMGTQRFNQGLFITNGELSSSTGPMHIAGIVQLNGGVLRGEGGVTAITAFGGTIEPGPKGPGVLTATSITMDGSTIFSVILNGTEPGTEHSQLVGKGLVELGNSLLTLLLRFKPPLGTEFEILAAGSISGTFQGLEEGATFAQDGFLFHITYQGGPGNSSVVVTRIG